MTRLLKPFIKTILLCFIFCSTNAQELTVKQIMQDPKWMGTFPSNINWDINSEYVFFDYNQEKNLSDSIYVVNIKNSEGIKKAEKSLKKLSIQNIVSSHDKSSRHLSIDNGNLMILNKNQKEPKLLLDLNERIENPQLLDEYHVSFIMDNNAYLLDLKNYSLEQLTHLKKGKKAEKTTDEKTWLEKENVNLIRVLKREKEKDSLSKDYRSRLNKKSYTFYYGKKSIYGMRISPSLNAVGFNTYKNKNPKYTLAADYLDKSGYTKSVNARPKVNQEGGESGLVVYNLKQDTAYVVEAKKLPGIKKQPGYYKDYSDRTINDSVRPVNFSSLVFSDDGSNAIVEVRSQDNKDRWICLVELGNGKLSPLDHQRDEAWIGGPGIGSYGNSGVLGWLPDGEHIYFQSEETGYSHLYLYNIKTQAKTALTSGQYEVFNPKLSKDKKHWYFTSSKGDLRQRHFFKMPLMGGKIIQLTEGVGKHDVILSPDEKQMAILFSQANQPPELFIKKNKKNTKPQQVTFGQSDEFKKLRLANARFY